MVKTAVAALFLNILAACGIKLAKEQTALQITTNSTATLYAFMQATQSECTEFEIPRTVCDPRNNPDTTIANFIKEKERYKFMSRPVNPVARQLMCGGLAVGKGFDIKSKSSKLREPEVVDGFVPYCQACLDSEQFKNLVSVHLANDLWFSPRTKDYQLPENLLLLQEIFFLFLRIQLKLNTALLSHCPFVCSCVTGVTSHISHIYKGINAMLIIRGPTKPYIF